MVLKGDTSFAGVFAALDAGLRFESKAQLNAAGRLLLRVAKRACVNRSFDELESICDLILTLIPGTKFADTALYYKAHRMRRKGLITEAREQLTTALGIALPIYKAGALMVLGCTYLDTGEIAEFQKISREAVKASRGTDPLSEVQSLRNMAIAESLLGNHEGALAMLESVLPIMLELGAYYPTDLLSHLNSVAIELGEVGRVDEGNRIIDYVLSSSLAENQLEWHDTKAELATKPRLIFTPFSMALGSPVEPRIESTASLRPEPPVPASASEQEAKAKARFVRAHSKAQFLPEMPPVRRSPLGRPSQYASTILEWRWVVSPPTRAPPSASSAI